MAVDILLALHAQRAYAARLFIDYYFVFACLVLYHIILSLSYSYPSYKSVQIRQSIYKAVRILLRPPKRLPTTS